MKGPSGPAHGSTHGPVAAPDAGWMLQWWQAKASVFEQIVRGPGTGAVADPDVIAAPTVVRLLQATDELELAHQACRAWSDVHALTRAGTPARMLAAVAARIGVAFSSRLHDLVDDDPHRPAATAPADPQTAARPTP